MVLRFLQTAFHRYCPRVVITRRLHGLQCRVNINDHLHWLALPETESVELKTCAWVDRLWGTVWDIGSNFGFYSMVAARRGNRVVAFDMSPYVLTLLQQSCRLNNLSVQCVPRAVTISAMRYVAPQTGSCKNALSEPGGDARSLTYLEASSEFGIPEFIKLDIEGGEREFFESMEFCQWIQQHGITVCVELHNGYRIDETMLPAMCVLPLDSSHQVVVPRG
jgi:FkbM family methyltransferase